MEVDAELGCEQLRVEELCSAWKLRQDWGFAAACGGALLSLEVESRLRGLQLCVEEVCSAWRSGPD